MNQVQSVDLPERDLINGFAEFLREKKRAPSTIDDYCGDARAWLKWSQVKGIPLDGIDNTSLHSYLSAMRTVTISTAERRVASLSVFAKFLETHGVYNRKLSSDSVLSGLSLVAPEPRQTFSESDIERLVEGIRANNRLGTYRVARDVTYVVMLSYSGLNQRRLLNLDARDLSINPVDEGYLLAVPSVKTGSPSSIEFVIPLHYPEVLSYKEKRAKFLEMLDKSGDTLFLNRHGGPMSQRVVRANFSGRGAKMGYAGKSGLDATTFSLDGLRKSSPHNR